MRRTAGRERQGKASTMRTRRGRRRGRRLRARRSACAGGRSPPSACESISISSTDAFFGRARSRSACWPELGVVSAEQLHLLDHQAEEVARRDRQLREHRRAGAQLAERAREPGRAARSPAAPSRRRAARRPGRAAPAPRAAAAESTRRAAQGLAAVARARLAEPTARPAGANGLSSGRRAVGSGDPDAGAWAALGRPRGLAAVS